MLALDATIVTAFAALISSLSSLIWALRRKR